VILWCIAGLELTLVNNHVTGVNYLGTTGQLIPFIIGATSLPTVIWGVIEKYHDKHEHPQNYEELNELYERREPRIPEPLNMSTGYRSARERKREREREREVDAQEETSKRFSDTSSLLMTSGSGKPSPALLSPDPFERS